MWLDTFWWKNTSQLVKLQMCFLFVYLLKYKTVIIKANTIIVSTIKANKSKYSKKYRIAKKANVVFFMFMQSLFLALTCQLSLL